MPLSGDVSWHYSKNLTTTKERIMLVLRSLDGTGASARELAIYTMSNLKLTIKALKLLYDLQDIYWWRENDVVLWDVNDKDDEEVRPEPILPFTPKEVVLSVSTICKFCKSLNNGMARFQDGVQICFKCEHPLETDEKPKQRLVVRHEVEEED